MLAAKTIESLKVRAIPLDCCRTTRRTKQLQLLCPDSIGPDEFPIDPRPSGYRVH
jgi:hypothetical protein